MGVDIEKGDSITAVIKRLINFVYLCLLYLLCCFGHFGFIMIYNLLITGGDIESNPGPRPTENTLSIVHIHINSLRNKVLLIEAELSMFDIIVVT